jgi:hydrogenase nickel incorporation protein HypB
MSEIDVNKRILGENDRRALGNSLFLAGRGMPCLNVISSPGAGKTTLLARTIKAMGDSIRIGVIEGDITTSLDAEKIRSAGGVAIQINTDGACHLSAAQVFEALGKLPLDDLDMIVIENVGNLVCPSAFALGESAKVAVLSVAEGDDKPAKYPALFARSRALLINKMDLLGPAVDFDMDRATADVRALNKDVEIFPVSAVTGQGMEGWYEWLREQVRRERCRL